VFIQSYQPDELRFAYCYRVFFRCRTYKFGPVEPLALLDRRTLNRLVTPYNLRVLESTADTTDLLSILSLQPTETISAAVSKLKGRVSKWTNEVLCSADTAKILSRGYFACTVGKSRREAVERYLAAQASHHGYDRRVIPPIYVKQYELSQDDLARVSPKHAAVIAEFHIVLATRYRKGVFGTQQGREVSDEWHRLHSVLPIAVRKVSFVPDHVHIAVRCHPQVAPSEVVVQLMNSAQQVVSRELVRVGLDRLWEPSAYIGSFGDLASPQVRKYIEEWKKGRME
jgi:REP-associated tyrosine transposase